MLTGMPATVVREVGAVIEVEAAQEVLVGLALAAVLRDDDARHGLEHFAVAHERPLVELLRGDRALARRLRDADEILGRVLDVGEVGERPLAGHRHVGVQRQMQDRIEAHDPGGRDLDLDAARLAKLISVKLA